MDDGRNIGVYGYLCVRACVLILLNICTCVDACQYYECVCVWGGYLIIATNPVFDIPLSDGPYFQKTIVLSMAC